MLRGVPTAVVVTWLATCSLASADAPVVRGGVRADGIAAVVGGTAPGPGTDVVLRSDVELRARIAVAAESPHLAVGGALPRNLLAAALDQLVGELLISREAERVRVSVPGEAEVRREVERFEAQAGGAGALRSLLARMGARAVEVETMARRRAMVSAFLSANLEGTATVTDAEVERVYESGEHPFTDRELEEVRLDLRAWLSRLAVERAVRRWVTVLRARTPVALLVRFGSEPAR
jgi:hypothetical protein